MFLRFPHLAEAPKNFRKFFTAASTISPIAMLRIEPIAGASGGVDWESKPQHYAAKISIKRY
jgi:hypothetical protein